jgi:hypothetical protein
VVQLVETLRYNRKFAGLIPEWIISPSERTMASNRNECQGYILRGKGDRCLGLTTLPPSCSYFLEIVGAPTSLSPRGACPDLRWHGFTYVQVVAVEN